MSDFSSDFQSMMDSVPVEQRQRFAKLLMAVMTVKTEREMDLIMSSAPPQLVEIVTRVLMLKLQYQESEERRSQRKKMAR